MLSPRPITIMAAQVPQKAFTTAFATGIFTSAAHGLSNDQKVIVDTSAANLPAGLSTKTAYYVISAATNTFQLSTVIGGPAVALTDNGTGTHTWYLQPASISCSGFSSIRFWVTSASTPAFTIHAKVSDKATEPNFFADASASNPWSYARFDNVDGSEQITDAYDGSGGLAIATAYTKCFTVNTDGARYMTVSLSDWTAGTAAIYASLSGEIC
jgi:hypothetical protein